MGESIARNKFPSKLDDTAGFNKICRRIDRGCNWEQCRKPTNGARNVHKGIRLFTTVAFIMYSGNSVKYFAEGQEERCKKNIKQVDVEAVCELDEFFGGNLVDTSSEVNDIPVRVPSTIHAPKIKISGGNTVW